MRRHMFGDVVEPSIAVGTGRGYSVPLSILTHVAVVGALALVPVLATGVLPTPPSVLAFVVGPPPPPPPAPPDPPLTPRPLVEVNRNAAPIEAPNEIVFDPPPLPPPSVLGLSDTVGVVGGIPMPGASRDGVVERIPPPPPQAVPIRVGGVIEHPTKIRDVLPVYPQLAQSARVSGIVIIEAIIAKDGTVRGAKVLRSVPLLDRAALEAVRQWRYTPTTLNGIPVEVIITVTVNFSIR